MMEEEEEEEEEELFKRAETTIPQFISKSIFLLWCSGPSHQQAQSHLVAPEPID